MFAEISTSFSEGAALCVHAWDFLNIRNVPLAALLDHRGELVLHRLILTEFVAAECLHSGMLPCFFLGLVSRLFSRARREVMMRARVSAGSMAASMWPRSAATYGFAKRPPHSASF